MGFRRFRGSCSEGSGVHELAKVRQVRHHSIIGRASDRVNHANPVNHQNPSNGDLLNLLNPLHPLNPDVALVHESESACP